MNIKRLCLIVGLLNLPITCANAAEITFNVPIELTNVPPANTSIVVYCAVGVGTPNLSSSNHWPPSGDRGIANASFSIPIDRNLRSVANIKINARDGATHYVCKLNHAGNQPNLEGTVAVTGPISDAGAGAATLRLNKQ